MCYFIKYKGIHFKILFYNSVFIFVCQKYTTLQEPQKSEANRRMGQTTGSGRPGMAMSGKLSINCLFIRAAAA